MSYVNNIRMFVRVYELGSMSAAARDQRTSPAVASARISELEKHLGVRLFSRTTRSLQPTENGRIFYDGARRVLEAIDDAESAVMDVTQNPRGTIFIAAPLGIGRRLIAPRVPAFKDQYPQIDVRLRLSDRGIDVVAEGIDVAFHLGLLEDSTLKVRTIADCPRLLCAAPAYIDRRGMPADGEALVRDRAETHIRGRRPPALRRACPRRHCHAALANPAFRPQPASQAERPQGAAFHRLHGRPDPRRPAPGSAIVGWANCPRAARNEKGRDRNPAP
jgi:DNA-binding transcriptional LysR family regulator